MASAIEARWIRRGARAAIGVACLLAQITSPAAVFSAVTVASALFTLYALLGLLSRKLDPIENSIGVLLAETAFFVAFVSYGADRGGWIGTALFAYLAAAGALGHHWADLLIAAAFPLVFFATIRAPQDASVIRVVVAAGLLGWALAYLRDRFERRLADAARTETELRGEVDRVRDLERQRIAGDFHDGPLQLFIALQVRLDILGTLFKRDRAAAADDLKELQQLSRQQVAEIRSFLRSMRPLEVDASDLIASARRIVEYFQKDTGISSRFISTESSIDVVQETSHEILQILRESLNNVQKHARAGRVVVSLEQNGREVELSIDDDGTGFAFSGTFNLDELDLLRLGPQSIKRRVRSLGGELQIESRPGHGAGLNIRVPC